jgi:hypothetical protein
LRNRFILTWEAKIFFTFENINDVFLSTIVNATGMAGKSKNIGFSYLFADLILTKWLNSGK